MTARVDESVWCLVVKRRSQNIAVNMAELGCDGENNEGDTEF